MLFGDQHPLQPFSQWTATFLRLSRVPTINVDSLTQPTNMTLDLRRRLCVNRRRMFGICSPFCWFSASWSTRLSCGIKERDLCTTVYSFKPVSLPPIYAQFSPHLCVKYACFTRRIWFQQLEVKVWRHTPILL